MDHNPTSASAPHRPAGRSPLRRARSVRRTSTVAMAWPAGRGTQLQLDGSARDIVTAVAGEPPKVVASAEMHVGMTAERVIEEISVVPPRAGIDGLVGARAGSSYRRTLDAQLPDDRHAGTPLYLLLDDLAGASLIAGFAWSRWTDDWRHRNPIEGRAVLRKMEGVCIGFRPGSSALTLDGTASGGHNVAVVPPLPHPDDPAGWHELPTLPPVSMCRARRIDAWVEGDEIRIDSTFQDSAGAPDGHRVAVHEYNLSATADISTGRLVGVEADPRVLPYVECPAAAANVDRLVGVELGDLRSVVLEQLARTAGCTHLNDALRALAEVPLLITHLEHHG